ncbi:MAG: HEAT repeat domain-containing protein [Fimbriimonadales bacterium]
MLFALPHTPLHAPIRPLIESTYMQEPSQEWVTLGEITMFGQEAIDSRKLPERKVAIKFPKESVPPVENSGSSLKWGDWNVQLNEWGNLGRVYRGAGGWGEFKSLYEIAQKRIGAGKSYPWKVKAVIFRRTDVLYKRGDGVLERQYGDISDEDVTFCLETFARFEAVVEAFTGGALDIQLSAAIETDPVVGSYEKEEVWSFHPFDAGDNYLRGRFNRGDFDSILYFYHPADTRAFSFGGTIGRTNNATQSYVILSNGREMGDRIGHTEAMVHEWYHQIEDTYFKHGYGGFEGSALPELHSAEANGYTTDVAGYSGWFSWLRDLMHFSVRDGMWAKLKNRQAPDFAGVRSQTHAFDGQLHRWNDVKDDPWAKLPFLTTADLAKQIGATSVEIVQDASQVLLLPRGMKPRTQLLPQIRDEDFALNNELNFSREAMARVGYQDRDLVLVRFDAADYVIDWLGDHAIGTASPANVMGYLNVGTRMMIVLDTKLSNDTLAELNLLNMGSAKSGVAVLGKGNYGLGEPMRVSFAAEVPDARYTVTEPDGSGIPMNGGLLELGGFQGTKILKVIAALPSGERAERLFAVRRLPTVQIGLQAVGTSRISTGSHKVRVELSSLGEAATIGLRAQLPSGWSISGLPEQISVAAGEQKVIEAMLSIPGTSSDGNYEIAVEARSGDTPTGRLQFEKFTAPTLVSNSFSQGHESWDSKRPDNAGWTVTLDPAGVEGGALAIKDRGGARWGRVNAFGRYLPNGKRDPAFMGYDVAAYSFLDFDLKTSSEDNLALAITLSSGKRYVVMLAGPYQEQWGESVQLPRAKFIPNGQWQRIVYNLNDALKAVAGAGPHYVVDIGFGDSRTFSSNQYFNEDVRTHKLDEFRITREADTADNTTKDDRDAELSAGADPTSANPEDRSRAAAALGPESSPEQIAAIRALIRDEHPQVRLNTAAAFARVKDPEAVPLLAAAARIERQSYQGVYMVRALEYQNLPESWKTMEALVRQGRAEEMAVGEAAMAMARSGDAKKAPDISVVLTAKSWQARRDGAKAIGMLPGTIPQQMLMMFLMEVDPMVRIAVARGADVDVDPVGKRMEWGSVNDLSNVVRAYDYASLTKSADPVRRSRGYAGLKEPDTDIRRIIAEEMGNDSKDHHVQPLLGLLSDPAPEVRAAAVISLIKMPGKRDFSEMTALAGEDYEEVLIPLLAAAKEKKIELPRVTLERLAMHRNSEVRKLVKEITG